ncbi:MAG: tRNA glutamyl-Q(34) synthetase GluQRS [Nakamurella sp.]
MFFRRWPARTQPGEETVVVGAGRYAPSPSGDLHLGNLRTAVLAQLFARSSGRRFLLRIEDLDRVRPGAQERQVADLRAIGIGWDDVVRQSERRPLYDAALAALIAADRVYECFCTRREIQEAASAPHAPPGAYPGTCRHLTETERTHRRALRPAALRLRSEVAELAIDDLLAGPYTGQVDDFVLRRTDGVPAYNLAVVVDDGAQGVDQVVRGDDLLPSTPRQAYLAGLLGLAVPQYVHVPLVLGPTGARLAKRDGAVTLAELAPDDVGADDVLSLLAVSLDLAQPGEPVSMRTLERRFDPAAVPLRPWTWVG